jgi:hypothetical protein
MRAIKDIRPSCRRRSSYQGFEPFRRGSEGGAGSLTTDCRLRPARCPIAAITEIIRPSDRGLGATPFPTTPPDGVLGQLQGAQRHSSGIMVNYGRVHPEERLQAAPLVTATNGVCPVIGYIVQQNQLPQQLNRQATHWLTACILCAENLQHGSAAGLHHDNGMKAAD